MNPTRLWRLLEEAGAPWCAATALSDRAWRTMRRHRPDLAAVLEGERKRLSAMGSLERKARREGLRLVAGVDEAGRGPLAGPLVAAAVVFEEHPWLIGLNDSKQLLAAERDSLRTRIERQALSYAVGVVLVEEMRGLSMHQVNLLAMERARHGLGVVPDMLLLDGKFCIRTPDRQQAVVKGDSKSYSVAAASILAKVGRDELMLKLHERYPQYGFDAHKGYATPDHLAALREHGPCEEHRIQFKRVRDLMEGEQLPLLEELAV
ncbi:MAG: ribonuclease HII [Candidatus Xenobia bacterium]